MIELSCSNTSAYNLMLTWSIESISDSYNVYRDSALLSNTVNTYYLDVTAKEGVSYVYEVKAVNAGTEDDSATITVVPTEMSLTLITDRSAMDLATLTEIIPIGYANMNVEQQEVFDGESKGAYNNSDLNRVSAAVKGLEYALNDYANVLNPLLASLGVDPDTYFGLPYTSPLDTGNMKMDYVKSDVPSNADMETYFNGVNVIAEAFRHDEGVPDTIVGFDYLDANAIEQALLDTLNDYIEWKNTRVQNAINASDAWFYCGEIFCGEY